jgi:uncharacterized HAD superfamily protein
MKIDGYEIGKKMNISIDFDKTIHSYHRGWDDGSIYGFPIKDVKKAIDELKKEFRIVIFTCRHPLRDVEKWLRNRDIYFDKITHLKEPSKYYIDDNAIRFTNWKHTMVFINERKNL